MSKADEFQNWDTNKQVDYVCGSVLVAIGSGDFKSRMYTWLTHFQSMGYERGLAAGKKMAVHIRPIPRRRKRSMASVVGTLGSSGHQTIDTRRRKKK